MGLRRALCLFAGIVAIGVAFVARGGDAQATAPEPLVPQRLQCAPGEFINQMDGLRVAGTPASIPASAPRTADAAVSQHLASVGHRAFDGTVYRLADGVRSFLDADDAEQVFGSSDGDARLILHVERADYGVWLVTGSIACVEGPS